jgi:hypothetical protein
VVPERTKDYISRPKPNGYRALHTTVELADSDSGREVTMIAPQQPWFIPERLLRVEGDLDTFEAVTRLQLGDGRGRLLAPGEASRGPPRRRRSRPAA